MLDADSHTGECHWQADVFSERGTKEGCLMAEMIPLPCVVEILF